MWFNLVFIMFQITFQVKRVRKPKGDGSENVGISDESQTEESMSTGNSVLEISGPTIPSPGPSGNELKLHFNYLQYHGGGGGEYLRETPLFCF